VTKQLDTLYETLLRMGSLVEEALRKALIALSNWDTTLATTVIDEDERIDAMQAEIEDRCITVIQEMQPTGSDLRDVVSCIKTVTELERIGDHARHIARTLEEVAGTEYSAMLPQIRELGDKVLAMVHDALTAFIDRDADKAREVGERDQLVDEIHRGLTQDALTTMKSRGDKIEAGEHIIMLSRFMERIGDHVTNMCEWILYARTGERVEFDR